MTIKLKPKYVLVEDAALTARLRNFGAAIEDAGCNDGSAKVQLLEAAYLAEKGVLQLKAEDIIRVALKNDKLAREKLTVIRCLRDRGYITRASIENSDYLRVHRKGFRPDADRTHYLVKVVAGKWKPGLKELYNDLAFAGQLRKELVIAIAGKELQFIKAGRMAFE